jgi:hypothetical protein
MNAPVCPDGELMPAAEDAGRRLRAALDIGGRVERNPYGMVAGAVAVGFVLGGGLFTRLSARLFGVGLRIGLAAALPLLQRELVEVALGLKSTATKESD